MIRPALFVCILLSLNFNLSAGEISDLLRSRGHRVEERPLFAEYGGFGTSVHLDIPGPSEPTGQKTLMLAFPREADIHVPSAFLDLLEARGAPLPIKIAFLADEYPDHLGLRDLLDQGGNGEDLVLLYISLGQEVDSLEIHQGADRNVAPLGALKPLVRSLSLSDIPFRIPAPYTILHRIGLITGPEVLKIAQSKGTAGLLLTGRSETGEGQGVNELSIAEALYRYAEELSAAPFENDYRYTILHYGTFTAFMGEETTVALFVGLFAAILAFFIGFSITHRRYLITLWAVFIKRSWIIVLYLIFLFLGLMGSGPIFLTLVGVDRVGYGASALRLLLAFSLYFLASPLPTYLRLPRKAQFFGHASLLILILGALAAAALDASFLPIFLWSGVFALPAALGSSPQVVFLFSALAPLQILGALGSAVGSGDPTLPTMLATSRWGTTLFLGILILPFLFLFKRVGLLASGKRQEQRPLRIWLPRILFFLGTLGAVISYGQDLDKNPAIVETATQGLVPKLEVEGRTFLDRRILSLRLSATGRVDRFELSLETADAGGGILIYHAPMPYRPSDGGHRVEFQLGYGPTNPLELELVLPRDFQGTLNAAALRHEGASDRRETVSASIR